MESPSAARVSPTRPKTPSETTPLLNAATGGDPERYSAFGESQKKFIILTAALASTFSPFSSNIYYPAINSIADDLQVSIPMVNMTITAYMIFQGLAPTFMGNLSDTAGRRPVYVLCFTIYILANIGIALQHSFVGLLLLRCLQSSGSSATIALSNAVAADTVTSSERGMYLGIASLGSILGPALGPLLGGLLSQYLNWRSIFWFLAAAATLVFVPLVLFYPETCRAIVGDGSISPPAWNKSLLNYLNETKSHSVQNKAMVIKPKIRFPNPLTTLRLLFTLPTGLILLCNGVGYAAHFAVTSSMPSQFNEIYGLNDLQIGLTFIPISLGTILSAFANGYLLDWNFRRIARQEGLPILKGKKQDVSNFPIERARLQIALPMLFSAAALIVAYGWLLDMQLPIFAPLVLLFLIGSSITACYNVFNVLIVDLNYSTPATATAANNLVRCMLGAASTAVVAPILERFGRGWTYTFVAGAWLAATPAALLVYRYGFAWRRRDRCEES
uniref:Putative transporter n=1 Tax=Diffractella curvata TaxID=2819868 RepID=A0A7R6QMK7_9PEZI|nr:ZopL3 [Diffractella curvata]BBU42023.1 putative transporter [Diffractella curvata]